MPPKSKGEPAGLSAEEMEKLTQELERTMVQDKANEFVGETLIEAGKQLYEEYLCSREVPFTVERAVGHLFRAIQLAFIHPEVGDSHEDLRTESWKLSLCRAPSSSPMDNWSRGAIPIRKKKKNSDKNSIQSGPGSISKLPSESGRSKTRSVASKLKSGYKYRDGTADSKNSAKRKRGNLPDYLVKLNEEDDQLSRGTSQQAQQKRLNELQASENDLRQKAMREMEESKRQAEEMKAKKKQEEEEEAQRAEVLAKELKGKDFTLTEDGEVIIIQAVNGDKLPNKHYSVDHVIGETEEDEEEKNNIVEKIEVVSKDSARKSVSSDQGEKETSFKNKFYRSAESFQQSILKNPSLEVSAGVSIREGPTGKAGPAFEDNEKRMSHANFVLHQAMLESQYSTFTPKGLNNATSAETGNTIAQENLTAEASSSHTQNYPGDEQVLNVASGNGSRPGSQASTRSAAKEASGLDSKSNNSSAMKGKKIQNKRSSGSKSVSNQNQLLDVPVLEELDGQEDVDANLAMLNSPDWGQNRNPSGNFNPQILPGVLDRRKLSPPRMRERHSPSDPNSPKHLPTPIVSPKDAADHVGYIREFESNIEKGSIRVESDRALRLLGIPASRDSSSSNMSNHHDQN